jgi:hypothetical protein
MTFRQQATIPAGTRVPLAGERGSLTLENVIIYPVIMLFIFGFFQGALWFHARDVAHSAATAAYYAARLYGGSVEDGRLAGLNVINTNGGTVNGAEFEMSKNATTVTVTVTGSTNMVVAGFPGSSLSETVSGPVERYIAP